MTGTISHNSRCYIINGKPAWLVSGAMHYFRIPSALWNDRIRKAKLAGLNCIETYIAWNVHEPEEGRFDFSGEQDIDRFFSLVEEAGMCLIVRPGPYICAEWDNGGLPAWLTGKSGIAVREDNPIYLQAIDRYFDHLLPIVAKHQVTRGGGVVLVQNENEYYYAGRPGAQEYLQHLHDRIRCAGVDVPIISCNYQKVVLPDEIECLNSWHEFEKGIESLRRIQPDAPKMVTEYWDGAFEVWGQPAQSPKSVASVFRRCCEIIGSRAMWNYYMWHGGTNWSFYAARLFPNRKGMDTVTTSYDYGAPLSEHGGCTPLYLGTKTANWMAQNLGGLLCEADLVAPTASVDGPFLLQELASPQGRLIVVRTETDDQEPRTAQVTLGDGVKLSVDITDLQAAVIAIGPAISDGHTIDYTNGSVLSLGPLIIFGQPGTQGILSIDGEVTTFTYPADDAPMRMSVGGAEVLVLSTDGALRTWFLSDGRIIYGESDFPWESCLRLRAPRESLPDLDTWAYWPHFPMIDGEGNWTEIDGPDAMERLGQYLGYGWYRCAVNPETERDVTLYFPQAGDRILTFVNGQYTATWGKSDGASIKPMPIHLRQGENTLVFLADNMGRPNTGRKVGELKGIWGPIGLDWQEVDASDKTVASGGIPEEAKDRWELSTCWIDRNVQCRSVVWDADLEAGESLHLSILGLQEYSYVFVNDRPAYTHVATGSALSDLGYNEFPLDEFLRSGSNRVELRILGWASEAPPADVVLYRHRTDGVLDGSWGFMPFDPWQSRDGDNRGHSLRVYEAEFDAPSSPVPMWLDFSTMGKGQVYLNGRALGRYWSIGPQTCLYVPEPWLEERNRLTILEEQGMTPEGVRLRLAGS